MRLRVELAWTAACLLTAEAVELRNLPRVRDIQTMARLLAHMSVETEGPQGEGEAGRVRLQDG